MSQLPASTVRTLRPQAVKPPAQRGSNALAPAPIPGPIPVPAPAPAAPNKTVDLDVIGPRKLIRPTLPDSARRARQFRRDQEPTLIARSFAPRAAATQESSHAEAFYLQKQLQTQTSMVFILDDNEKIEGCIEWYDRNVIKVRSTGSRSLYFRANSRSESGARILVYKSSIKYLYKAGENSPL
jgi:sRNA-binding regulator protein Hfq